MPEVRRYSGAIAVAETVNSAPVPKPLPRVAMDITPHGDIVSTSTTYATYTYDEVVETIDGSPVVTVPAMYHHNVGDVLTFHGIVYSDFAMDIVEWEWIFGDGISQVVRTPTAVLAHAPITLPTVTHTYRIKNPGVLAHLRVADSEGRNAYATMNVMLVIAP